MCYAEGGVGHYKVNTSDVPPAQPQDTDENIPSTGESPDTEEDDVDKGEVADHGYDGGEGSDDDDARVGKVEGDKATEDSDEEEQGDDEEEEGAGGGSSDESSEDELGAEDGEGGWDDAENEEGYAPL